MPHHVLESTDFKLFQGTYLPFIYPPPSPAPSSNQASIQPQAFSQGPEEGSVNAFRPGLGQEIWTYQNRCSRFPDLGQAKVCLHYKNLVQR